MKGNRGEEEMLCHVFMYHKACCMLRNFMLCKLWFTESFYVQIASEICYFIPRHPSVTKACASQTMGWDLKRTGFFVRLGSREKLHFVLFFLGGGGPVLQNLKSP